MKAMAAADAATRATNETLRARLAAASGVPRDAAPTKCARAKGSALFVERDMLTAIVTKPAIDHSRSDGLVDGIDDWVPLSSNAVGMLRKQDWYAGTHGLVSAQTDDAARLEKWIKKGPGDLVVVIEATKTNPTVGSIDTHGEAAFDSGALSGRAIAIDPVAKQVVCQVSFSARNNDKVEGGIDETGLREAAVEDVAKNAHATIVREFASAGLALIPVEPVY